MKSPNLKFSLTALTILAAAFATAQIAQAHCDSLDGPVVNAARAALKEGNVALALIWVQPADETAITHAFAEALVVRQLSVEARELADRYFFETLVRIHRAGEGAPFTGLKPAGTDFGPSIPATDAALESGDVEPVLKMVSEKAGQGIREHFKKALAKKKLAADNVEAGRAYVAAYVVYTHYVKGIHDAAVGATHGHFPEAEGPTATAHLHEE